MNKMVEDRCLHTWMDGLMDGRMDGWIGGMDGWMGLDSLLNEWVVGWIYE